MTKSVGRPKKEINWEILDTALKYGGLLLECVELLGASEDTIQRAIKKKHKMSFKEYRDLKIGKMRSRLRQLQHRAAENGNIAMLIWLGKQYLGQKDKQEIDNTSSDGSMTPKVVNDLSHLSDEDLEKIKSMLKKPSENSNN